MVRFLLGLLTILVASLGLAQKPRAGSYAYISSRNGRPLALYACLKPAKSGNFGVEIVAVTTSGASNEVSVTIFNGTLFAKGAFKGAAVAGPKLNGEWNSTGPGLSLHYEGEDRLLKRSGDVFDYKPGYYALSKTDVSKPGDPYLGWTSEVTATTMTDTFNGNSEYKEKIVLNGVWDSPPPVLIPGQTFELTCSLSAQMPMPMKFNAGVGGKWNCNGAIELLSSEQAYAGWSSGEARFIPSSVGHAKFKVLSGDKIALWGGGGTFLSRGPAVFVYEWKKV